MDEKELEETVERLLDLLSKGIAATVGPPPYFVGFSGGLDSSLLAHLVQEHAEGRTAAQGGRPRLVAVGLEGAHDLIKAEEAVKLLALPLTAVRVTPAEVLEAGRSLSPALAAKGEELGIEITPVTLAFQLPLYFAAREVARAGGTRIVTGQGADELAGGYARYLEMSPSRLEEELRSDAAALMERGIELDRWMAGQHGVTLKTPYLHEPFVEAMLALPAVVKVKRMKGKEPSRKFILREMGRAAGLHPELAERPKKAAQYGSGIANVLRQHARAQGVDLRNLVTVWVREG